ncbi:hypothetical protein L2E82_15365 [Cichorium intybus]|uniref:Uncharacterized protein n=1 Tax=Cichorium intybus TaxID=13427 RepID=A0ACB9F359_CICIN|nr:hypothetical protein L2E82_15365 [Cichorium intybus]
MVSDQEIAKGIQILLTQSHPKSFTTLDHVVNQLSEKLGFDLSHKAAFIRDQINLLLFPSQSQYQCDDPPPRPPPPLPSVPSPVTTSGISKDQFFFQQQQPQFHFNQQQPHAPPPPLPRYHHPHFSFEHQESRQRHPVELNFSNPDAPPPPPEHLQVQTLPDTKFEGVPIQNAVWKSSGKLRKGASTNRRRGGPGGLYKLCGISPELQVILGESSLSRTDIVKQLWAYIKKNNLQDPGNKRKINCDDALRVVFETDCTDMFKMNKLLAKHIIPLEPTKVSSRKKQKVKVDPAVESSDFVPCQVIISEALANCLEMEERKMSQSEALRLIWEYIKVNNLEVYKIHQLMI